MSVPPIAASPLRATWAFTLLYCLGGPEGEVLAMMVFYDVLSNVKDLNDGRREIR
jgi:hypothetical protein